jgi:hypothetical protein
MASFAASGQAHGARERSPQEEAAAASQRATAKEERLTTRSERAAARKAQREAERRDRRSRTPTGANGNERENAVVWTTCTSVEWRYRDFPNRANNTVVEKLTVGNAEPTWTIFKFNGASGTDTTSVQAPVGRYRIATHAKWDTNGLKGGFDIATRVTCPPAPAFSIEELQKIEGAGAGYTREVLDGQRGQTIDYELLVQNTGNESLDMSNFTDTHCDPGTVSGGPGSAALAVGASATYLCTHLLDAADQIADSYSNTATLTGTPTAAEYGSPITQTSNAALVAVAAASTPASSTTPADGVPPSSSAAPASEGPAARGGVLAFSQTAVPGINAPQGCARSSFRASLKSAGVARVTFYLDGHRLRTMTAKSARRGQFAIVIDTTRLKVGVHHLRATITMAQAASGKPVHASRTVALLRCLPTLVTPKFTG